MIFLNFKCTKHQPNLYLVLTVLILSKNKETPWIKDLSIIQCSQIIQVSQVLVLSSNFHISHKFKNSSSINRILRIKYKRLLRNACKRSKSQCNLIHHCKWKMVFNWHIVIHCLICRKDLALQLITRWTRMTMISAKKLGTNKKPLMKCRCQ